MLKGGDTETVMFVLPLVILVIVDSVVLLTVAFRELIRRERQ